MSLISRVRRERLTYLDRSALEDLALRVQELEAAGRPGDIVEAGCALGGSAIVLASEKRRERTLRVYDVFGMIPPPSERDGDDVHQRYDVITAGRSEGIGGDRYYGYVDDLRGEVERNFGSHGFAVGHHNVRLHPGLFEEALYPPGPVALAHVDCDWYASVTTCLERIVPHLVPGGVLVVDDYDHWSGAQDAVDDFFRGRPGFRFERRSRLHVVRDL